MSDRIQPHPNGSPTRRERRAQRREARAVLRARRAENRAAARIRRTGTATLTTHAIAAGLTPRSARSVAGSLRNAAAKTGITGQPGTAYRKGNARSCTRYTPTEVADIATHYRPRKPEYKAAAARLTQTALEVAA